MTDCLDLVREVKTSLRMEARGRMWVLRGNSIWKPGEMSVREI